MHKRILGGFYLSTAPIAATCLLFLGTVCFGGPLEDDKDKDDLHRAAGNSGFALSQADALRQFEAASEQEYTIGAGDEIEVLAPGKPELQGHHVVGPDGLITLPLVGSMKVSGLKRETAGQEITKAWEQYYSSVSATVQISKYGSNRIVVVGRVATPGPLYFERTPTLLEALAKSGAYGPRPATNGGVTPVANPGPSPMISRCAVYRGSEQVLWIDMRDLFASGAGVDLHLRRDDVVYVPDEQEDLVSVLGQVGHPGAVRLTDQAKMADILALAGGLTDDAASDKIRVVRPSTGMVLQVSLKDLLDPARARNSEVSLKRGDVIYVPKSGFGKFGYVLGRLSPASNIMMFGAVAAGR